MKKYLIIFFSFFILSIGTAALRGDYVSFIGLEAFYLSAFVGFLLFGVVTIVTLHKTKNRLKPLAVLLTILLAVSIIELPVRIFDFSGSLFSLGSSLAWWAGILMGYAIFKTKPIAGKVVLSLVAIAFISWFSYQGYEMWVNKMSYGSTTGATEEIIESRIVFQTIDAEEVTLDDFKGRYVLLDFWGSFCGGCFRAFPKVQEVYDLYKGNPEVEIYSVFCRNIAKGETPQKGAELLRKGNYTFPALSMDVRDAVLKEIGVTDYPTVIIFDPEGKLVFRGNIKLAKIYLSKLFLMTL